MITIVSDEIFLEDLRNTKRNLISIQGSGTGLQDMINSTTHYLDNIKSSKYIIQVDNLMSDLYRNALGNLPFVYDCLIDKSALIR